MTSAYCTTQDILDFDPNAAYLRATPDSPDFTNEISTISTEIDLILQNTYPRVSSSDVSTSAQQTQLKLICIHGVLAHLYRSAVLTKGSGAQYQAESHRTDFQNLLKLRLDLINGETVSPAFGRVVRG